MNKAKKLTSIILAAVMVLSVCPVGLSTVAQAATPAVSWSEASSSVTATVTATEVIRVAKSDGSFLNGTKVVQTNAMGYPAATVTDLLKIGYDNDTNFYAPSVTLNLNTPADEGTVTITPLTTAGAAFSTVYFSNVSVAGNSYTWTMLTGTNEGVNASRANEGDTIIYKIDYKIDGTSYTSYGSSNVREVPSVPGTSIIAMRYKYYGLGTGSGHRSRFGVFTGFAAYNMYGRIGYMPENNGWTWKSLHNNAAQVNYNCASIDRSATSSDTSFLIKNGTANANHPAAFANGLSDNKDKMHNTAYGDDQNRPRADIFVDTSVYHDLADINMKYIAIQVDQTDYNEYQCDNLKMNKINVQLNAASNVGGETNELTLSNNYTNLFNMPYNNHTMNCNTGGGIGTNFKDYITGSGLFVDSYLSNGTPTRISLSYCYEGSNGGSQTVGGVSAIDFYFYMVNKGDLRNLVSFIQGGASSFTPAKISVSALNTSSANFKGFNPQAASFTDASYSAFLTAYKAAIAEISNGKSTSQNTVNTLATNLYNAYVGLVKKTVTVTANLYLQGTTTPVPVTVNSVNYSTYAGNDVTITAPDLSALGYTLVTPAVAHVVAAEGAHTEYYYTPRVITFTFDPQSIDAGNPKTKNFTFGTAVNPMTDAPNFTNKGYEIEGWYSDSGLTNKVTGFTVDTNYINGATFYAKWQLAPVKLKYDMGSTGVTWADVNYYPGDQLRAPSNPSIPGYGFSGWYKESTYTTPFDWNYVIPQVTDNDYVTSITAYAKFVPYNGFLLFNSNGATGGDACNNIDVSGMASGQSVTLPQPTKTGYNFAGWYLDANLTQLAAAAGANLTLSASTINGAMLYAKWTAKQQTINFNLKYNASSASPIDTATNPASITGYINANIPQTIADSNGQQVLPTDPVKYGYEFRGWTKATASNRQIFNNEADYRNAVNNGYRYSISEADAIFQPSDDVAITLYPMWVKVDTSAYIKIETFKEMYGELKDTNDPDTVICPDDIITVRMSSTSNFYTGSSVFVYMYDNDFFELVGSGSDAFTLNAENDYISAINGTADYSGFTAAGSAGMPAGIPSGFDWIQVAIDPDVDGGKYLPGAMNGKTWMVEFKLKVIGTTGSGDVFMDNAWTRNEENNAGTMFYGWCSGANSYVWTSHNNYVTPDLSLATRTVTITSDESIQSTVTVNPNGGAWADSSTGTKSYTGDVGEVIVGYAEPTRTGYTLDKWVSTTDSTDEWISGYYGSPAQDGKTFNAQWTPNKYNVTWVGNGGTFGTGTQLVEALDYDSSYSAPATLPTKTGYTLAGWTEDGAAVTFPQTMGTTERTFSAVWEAATDTPYKVRVTYHNNSTDKDITNDYTVGANNKQFIGTTGATVHLVADASGYTDTATDVYLGYADLPVINNYVFDPTAITNFTTCTINADGSGTIYVTYIGKKMTTVFSANGGQFTLPSPASEIDSNGYGYEYFTDRYETYVQYASANIVPTVEPTKDGYDFGGWATSATGTSQATIPPRTTTERTFYAIWTGKTVLNKFYNNYSASDNTYTEVGSTMGKTITLPAAPTRAGYAFKGWATDRAATTGSTSLGTQSSTTPVSYYAVWQLTDQTYNINVYYMGTDGNYPATPDTATTAEGIGVVSVDPATYAQTGFTFDSANSTVSATLDTSTAGTTVTLVVKYARNKYDLTFSIDGDNQTSEVYYGAAITAPTASKTGYTFTSWTPAVPATMPATDSTYTAQFTINSYLAYFKVPAGSSWNDYVDPVSVNYGAAITAPATNPTVTGYTFTGWSESADATTGSDDLGTIGDDNKTFYAIFTVNSYNAIFMSEGTEFDRISYNYGAVIEGPATNPTKYGYTFTGWAGGNVGTDTMGVNDVTFTAVFDAKTITNTFNANGGAYGSDAVTTVDSTFDGAVALPSRPTRAGYTFGGYAAAADATVGSNSLGNQTTETPATYYAVWTANSNNYYTINISKQNTLGAYDASDVTLNSSSVYSDGITDETKTITADTLEGFTLDSNASVLSLTIGVDTANTGVNQFKVFYTRNTYTLTVVDEDGSSGEPVYYGAAVADPTAAAKTGYTFSGWKWFDGDTEITKPATMPAKAITAVAQYTINKYTATFDANTGAWGSETTKTTEADYLAAIQAPDSLPTKTGYTCIGWAETADATAALADLGNMPLDGKTFYAVWNANDYDVTFNANTGAWGTDTTKTVPSTFDGAIVLPAVPAKTGYTFKGWALAADATTGSTELGNLTTVEPLTYYAVWSADTHDYFIDVYYAAVDGTYGAAAETITKSAAVDSSVDESALKDEKLLEGFVLDAANTVVTGTVPASGELRLVLKYSRQSYTVVYTNIAQATFTDAKEHMTDLSGTRIDTYTFGETVVPAVATRTGYTPSWVWSTGDAPATMPAATVTARLVWTANKYDVTFNGNNGAWGSDATQTVESTFNSAIALPAAAPERDGYTFAGYALAADATTGSTTLGNLTTVEPVTYYAVWTVNSYTATFNANNGAWGSETTKTTEANYLADITAPDSDPKREGYTFKGWAESADATEKLDSLGTMPIDGKTFYAVWTVNSYDITYYVDDVQYGDADSYDFGAAVTAKAAPTKTGYTFSGWATVPATMPAENVDVYGSFTANDYDVTFNANTGAWGTDTTKTVPSTFDGEINLPEVPAKAGYTFGGWALAADAATGSDDLGDLTTVEPLTYYAVWSADEHDYKVETYFMGLDGTYGAAESTDTLKGTVDSTVSTTPADVEGFTLDTDNSVLESTVPATGTLTLVVKYSRNQNDVNYVVDDAPYQTVSDVYYGAALTAIAAPTKEGYTFSGWSTMPATMPDEDVTVTGSFTVNSYKLTYKVDGETYDESDVDYGTTLTAIAAPTKEGYTFSGWSAIPATMPAEDVTVTGTFAINSYTLTYKVDGEEYNKSTVVYGTALTAIDAPTKEGYTFSGWSTVPATMPADDVTVTGTFAINSYTVTYKVDGETFATDTYEFGAAVTARPNPTKEGYTFSGWSWTTVVVPETMPAQNIEVNGSYSINSYTLTFVRPNLKADGTITTVDASDASTYTVISSNVVVFGADVVAPADPEIEYYDFVEWSIDVPEKMPASDLFIIASFNRTPVEITIVSASTTVIDKVDGADGFNGYIYGLAENLSVSEFKSDYADVIGNGHLVVTPVAQFSRYNVCGTGTKVELYDDVTNEVVETYYIVIYGDVNGDGCVSAVDVSMVKHENAFVASTSLYDGETETLWAVDNNTFETLNPESVIAAQLLAADLNGDGQITSADTALVNEASLWFGEINQVTGEMIYESGR